MSQYLKAIMAVLGAVLNGIAVYYGHTQWYPIVVSAVTVLTVYLVPNMPKTPAVTKMDVNSAYPTDGWDKIK